MASVNKVIIVGNMGNDPDVRTFDNGGKIATVSVATTDRWTDRNTGEPRESTEWHRIVFNNRLADIAQQYLRKGSQIYVEGSLHTRKWTDQQGIERYSTEIRATQMQMLGNRNQGNTSSGGDWGNQGGYQNNQGGYQNSQGGNWQNNQAPRQNYNNSGQNFPAQPAHNAPMQSSPQGNVGGNPMQAAQQPPMQHAQPAAQPNHNNFGAPPAGTTPAQNVVADEDIPF